VLNDSDFALSKVGIGTKSYGAIKPHAVSAYQTWNEAYEVASVSVMVQGESDWRETAVIDYFGVRRLGEGKYTYVLKMRDDGKPIIGRVVEDAK